MHFSILTAKTESFYTACSPELAVTSYGVCQDEALNYGRTHPATPLPQLRQTTP